jgi:hypothetical protein
MTDRRNPYLVLGIDHGADAAEAAAAFARATRRVRNDPDAPYAIEDITWALHNIEQAETDPEKSLDTFRVPADPSVYLDARLNELLPPPTPLNRTSDPGEGRQIVEDQARLAEIRHDLVTETRRALDEPMIDTSTDDMTEAGSPMPVASSSMSVGQHGSPAEAEAAKVHAYNLYWFIGAMILLAIVLIIVTHESRSSASSDGQSSTRDEQPSEPTQMNSGRPTAWVTASDCLIHVGAGEWEATACGQHDAEIVFTQGAARSDVCPGYADSWFGDDWGTYCAMIITDTTPAGGHWGIGPVHTGTCLSVDRQGDLLGKSACVGNALPVLTVASHLDACDVSWALGDYFVYFEATDGTNNYLCVDGYYWDAARLP